MYTTLYMLVGNENIAFVEGADLEILTDEQQQAEKERLCLEVPFRIHGIYPVKNGTILNLKVK